MTPRKRPVPSLPTQTLPAEPAREPQGLSLPETILDAHMGALRAGQTLEGLADAIGVSRHSISGMVADDASSMVRALRLAALYARLGYPGPLAHAARQAGYALVPIQSDASAARAPQGSDAISAAARLVRSGAEALEVITDALADGVVTAPERAEIEVMISAFQARAEGLLALVQALHMQTPAPARGAGKSRTKRDVAGVRP